MPPELIHRPWLDVQPKVAHSAGVFASRFKDALSLFRHAADANPAGTAICYFDGVVTYAELDRYSDAFACFLLDQGVRPGDRVALYMQNIPQYLICLVGAWKAGAFGVSINPMNRERELRLLLTDSGASVLVSQRDLHADVVRGIAPEFPGLLTITTSVLEFQSRNDDRVMPAHEPAGPADGFDLLSILRAPVSQKRTLQCEAWPESPAMIVYTSGTTGVPKGAIVTHANFAVDADLWRAWMDLRDGAPILAIAPLFHITGLVGHLGFAFALGAPVILSLRFHPEVVAQAAREHRAEFVVGAITAFIAIMNAPGVQREDLGSLRRVFSGGAPVPAAVVAAFHEKFGLKIRNAYGLTESSSLATAVPPECDTPVDANGALSVGVPVFDTDVIIADEQGQAVAANQVGEILLRGPQIVAGYWHKPKETAEALVDGFLHTGDVGYMDSQGWLYLVDRKKDMINAAGYKVWPKEVEDVIYTHPAVREAAVVGVPDGYRGETVMAVVSLKDGESVQAEELIEFCRQRMAAYKYPRQIQFMEELPKTLTGKILRRELRPQVNRQG
ncbi:MAG: AMP-binding protein, partial [Burkholderiaceae bacterium]|nr:AMP-binding protein [Burkholderiaceae bacterium]